MARRGNAAVIVALSLTVLLALAAIVLDVGYGRMVQRQLQDAADAAAHAAVQRFDGTAEGLTAARETAAWMASSNHAAGAGVLVDPDADVVLGDWDPEAGTFTPSDDPDVVDAVHVSARIAALGLFVAPVAMKQDAITVSASSRAFVEHGGAGSAECFLPIGMPACLVEHYTLEGLQDVTLVLNPPGVDNVAWARPNGSPNASWIRNQLGDCAYSGEIGIGEPMGLNNGVITSAMSDLAAAIAASPTRWDTTKWGTMPTRGSKSDIPAAKWGNTYEGVVPVFDGGPSYCVGSGGSFTGSAPIAGFVWGAVYDVVTTGAAAQKTIRMRLDFTREYNFGSDVGGPEWGVTADAPPRRLPLD